MKSLRAERDELKRELADAGRVNEQLLDSKRYADQAAYDVLNLSKDRDSWKAKAERYEKALREISEGKGRYSQDQFEHCRNTVEDMKELAKAALPSEGEVK